MKDTQWITAAINGDLEAFNELVHLYQDSVYAQAFWILNDELTAEDIAQEVFLRAYLRLSGFRGGSFRAWLLRITTNACYDELRRRKRNREVSQTEPDYAGRRADYFERIPDPGRSTEELVENKELSMQLHWILATMPVEFRQSLFLIEILEMKYEEAASILHVPVGTVKSRVSRARRHIIETHPEIRDVNFWSAKTVTADA